jgi:hypothetical protein
MKSQTLVMNFFSIRLTNQLGYCCALGRGSREVSNLKIIARLNSAPKVLQSFVEAECDRHILISPPQP